MAVIKIKNIKSNLQAVINYGKNGDKTENGILVSSVNCSIETAYEEMALTIIQSFKGNEVSPKLANQIGKELAEELWGDKYQVVICTHINKENVHNHMILNSVSFIDGIKYHNSKAQIAFLKETSDSLCLNYGLSIVDTPKANKEKEFRQKNIDYFNHTDEKMQRIITDIDNAIKSAKKYSDFKLILKSKGYENIKDSGKYLSLKTPYYSRNIRINRAFGEKYSVEGIKERIYGYIKEDLPPVQNYKSKYYKKIYTGPKINKFLLKTSSFYRLYVHYLYFFGILPAKNEYKELSPDYYKQKRKNNMIIEEINFLARHSFSSIAEITEYNENLENKLPELKGKRELLWKNHKSADTNKKDEILKDINALTEEIDKIQAQKNACNRIVARYEEIKNVFQNKVILIKKSHEILLTEKKRTAKYK